MAVTFRFPLHVLVLLCLLAAGSLLVSFNLLHGVEQPYATGVADISGLGMKRVQGRRRKQLVAAATSIQRLPFFSTERSSTSSSSNNKHKNQKSTFDTAAAATTFVVDMISVGSNTRPEFKNVQQRTFARHKSVRYFWRRTEHDDADPTCPTRLDSADVERIATFCHSNTTYPQIPQLARHFASFDFLLRKQSNPPGWLCAQKRPLDALYGILQYYRSGTTNSTATWQQTGQTTRTLNDAAASIPEQQQPSTTTMQQQHNKHIMLPDYLFVMDDDSWFHLDRVLEYLSSAHVPTRAHVIAGCLIRSQYNMHLSWYWGGFGAILTRGALERLLWPIHCGPRDNNNGADMTSGGTKEFVQHACHQLEQNMIGERAFFRDGISLIDLIHAYSSQQAYTRYEQWDTTAGYCMHSDTALAFFFNFYHVAEAPQSPTDGDTSRPIWLSLDDMEQQQQQQPLQHYDRLRAYNGTSVHRTKQVNKKIYKSYGYCLHKSPRTCTVESHLCHYISKSHMMDLFQQVYSAAPQNYMDQAKVEEPW